MIPAMDRVSSTPARRSWIVLGLGIFLGAINPGCAELKSQIFGDQKIGELGHVEDPNDVYSRMNPPRTLLPVPNQGTAPASGPISNEAQETNPTALPPEATLIEVSPPTGVALQTPRPVDPASGVKLTSATAGVPNAAKLLAAAERRTEVKPETIVLQARAALETMTSYEVAMHRQERVNGSLLPEEDVVLAIRRSPRAVRLTWPAGPNQGREALYRADDPSGQMQIKLANPALPRLSLNPESPMVMKNSRHPVTEAGFDSLIEGLENGVEASAITYTGVETPTGLDQPAHCLSRITPSGERWLVYLDVQNHLPTLVQAVDARGELLERYVFHDLHANPAELASADAFDPIARWGQPKGLFGRLTRSGSENSTSSTDSTPH